MLDLVLMMMWVFDWRCGGGSWDFFLFVGCCGSKSWVRFGFFGSCEVCVILSLKGCCFLFILLLLLILMVLGDVLMRL